MAGTIVLDEGLALTWQVSDGKPRFYGFGCYKLFILRFWGFFI